MPQDPHCEPAATVIEKMGGIGVVAGIVDLSPITVRRWRRPHPSGTDGVIPDHEKALLLEHAREAGIQLTWDDFKPPALIDGA